MTSLNETMTQIAEQIKCDANELIAYAQEDAIGGYHYNQALQLWPSGSIFGCEGQIIYALIRHLKPAVVAEIGGWAGCSAAHMAAAVKMNGVGHVYGIDDGSETTFEPYNRFPADLKSYVTFVRDDGRNWLAQQPDGSIGLLFDDASHAEQLIIELAHLGLQKCEPGGLLLNHDAMHDAAFYPDGTRTPSTLGRQVRDALSNAGLYFRPYLTEPSDCGLAITVIPVVKPVKTLTTHEAVAFQKVGNANIESEGLLTPAEPLQAQEKQTPVVPMSQRLSTPTEEDTKETPVKKPAPRGKGKRK